METRARPLELTNADRLRAGAVPPRANSTPFSGASEVCTNEAGLPLAIKSQGSEGPDTNPALRCAQDSRVPEDSAYSPNLVEGKFSEVALTEFSEGLRMKPCSGIRGVILCADRLTNPATYGCRKDDGKRAVERLLDGVRVGEENLLQHPGAACRPGRVVLEP